MVRSSVLGSLFASALLLAAACGGALAREGDEVDTGSTSSSSSSGTPPGGASSTSSTSGGPVRRDAGVVPVDAGSRVPTPGFVSCPTELDACTTATSIPFVCCVRKSAVYSCEKSADLCTDGDAIGCDENNDCAKGVCCAEQMGGRPTSTPFRFVTHCLPSCITGKPREQVCTSNADCPSSTCKEWSCGGFDMHGVKTCAPLGACD